LEKNNTKTFSVDDIAESISVMNIFTENINDAKRIFANILIKYSNKQLSLDEETVRDIVSWASDFAMVKERVGSHTKGIKPN